MLFTVHLKLISYALEAASSANFYPIKSSRCFKLLFFPTDQYHTHIHFTDTPFMAYPHSLAARETPASDIARFI